MGTAEDMAADQARWRSVLEAGDIAERVAYYVSQMRDAGLPTLVLPSADTVVRHGVTVPTPTASVDRGQATPPRRR